MKPLYICALIYNDKQWRGFLHAIGQADLWETDRRFADVSARSENIDAVYAFMSDTMRERTTAAWTALLDAHDVPVAPLHDLASIFDDPHLAATGFFRTEQHPSEGSIRTMRVPGQWSGTPPEPSRPAPRLGEHTVEVLRELGYDPARIGALLEGGACRAERSSGE